MSNNKFLNRVRDSLDSTFGGEETVRVVNYDEETDEEEARPQKPRQIRGQKTKRTKFSKPVRAEKPVKIVKPEPVHVPEEVVVPEQASKSEKAEEPAFFIPENDPDADLEDYTSAFDLNEAPGNEFLAETQKEYDKRFEGVPDLSPKDDKIQDVLEFASIPASFSIATGVFLPADLESIFFEMQRPQGYDVGQVNHFVKDTRTTVEHYVMLLEKRNQHVAQLASIIDRLQVSMMNEKLANESSEGISIMPTSDAGTVEAEMLELKLENQRLKDKVSDLSHGDQLSYRERELHELLKDELGVVRREKAQLEEGFSALQAQLMQLEENIDDDSDVYVPARAVTEDVEEKPEDENNFFLPDITEADLFDSAPHSSKKDSLYGASSAFSAPDQGGEDYIQLMDGEGFGTHDGTGILEDDLEDDDSSFDNMLKDWEYND